MRCRAATESSGGAVVGWDAMDERLGLGAHLGVGERLCSKVACAREAVATLTFDYADQMAALGPLGPGGDPHAHDLCASHADRLSVPAGWLVIRHEALRA
jgi:hypothetical protein